MIDLDKIGYNVIQNDSDDSAEITGGMTLTVKIKVNGTSLKLAIDPDAIILHVKKRIREKIWEMAYWELKEPMLRLRQWVDASDPSAFGRENLKATVDKLEEAIGERAS